MSDKYSNENTDTVLGREFLTWLWYRSDTANGLMNLSEKAEHAGHPFSVGIEQSVVVRGGEGDNLDTTSVSGSLSPLKEARIGLQMGKFVVSAIIFMEKDGLLWQMKLKAENFCIGSMRTPTVDRGEEGDLDALFLEKMYLIETGLEMLDDLYRQFLDKRLSHAWHEETRAIGEWIAQSE